MNLAHLREKEFRFSKFWPIAAAAAAMCECVCNEKEMLEKYIYAAAAASSQPSLQSVAARSMPHLAELKKSHIVVTYGKSYGAKS